MGQRGLRHGTFIVLQQLACFLCVVCQSPWISPSRDGWVVGPRAWRRPRSRTLLITITRLDGDLLLCFPACTPSGLCVTLWPVCDLPCAVRCSLHPQAGILSLLFRRKELIVSGQCSVFREAKASLRIFFFFLFLTLFLNPPLLYLWNLLYYLVITFSLKFPKDSLIVFIFPAFSSFRFGTSSFYTLPFLFFPSFLNLLHSIF